jgi:hypothetical protein
MNTLFAWGVTGLAVVGVVVVIVVIYAVTHGLSR